jgi:hypothetical protein
MIRALKARRYFAPRSGSEKVARVETSGSIPSPIIRALEARGERLSAPSARGSKIIGRSRRFTSGYLLAAAAAALNYLLAAAAVSRRSATLSPLEP